MNNKGSSKTKKTMMPIAIIGQSALFPEAHDLREFWDNILSKKDCITDVPKSHWDSDEYYDADPFTPDKTYCKQGGFIPSVDFDPKEFGIPPVILEAIDVSQLVSLVLTKNALKDAGFWGEGCRPFDRERTGVVLGVSGAAKLVMPLGSRLQYPVWEKILKRSGLSDEAAQKIITKMKMSYIEWEENSFPGILGNVVAGRICNRFDLGGTNCTVDAACASSLSAMKMAIGELVQGHCDMMLTGGVDVDNSIFSYICFSKTPALSLKSRSRPYDAEADGMMLGEGVGMILLKRLEDAERDGDKIYAVIKGIGSSSDGRFKSIYAPRREGQEKALKRAYEHAGIKPSSIGLIEGHGTGTIAGDSCEFSALNTIFSESKCKINSVALGSVKSQIGHTKTAAGVASMIKVALALHHKVLPPTINVDKPNPKFNIEQSPIYINTEAHPWIRANVDEPLRAGVSSFGFGGTNYHVVVEEYINDCDNTYRLHSVPEMIFVQAENHSKLLEKCEILLTRFESEQRLKNYYEYIKNENDLPIPEQFARVGFVAKTLNEVCVLLKESISQLTSNTAEIWEHPKGIYYRSSGLDLNGKVVALFSGQGSQYMGMGNTLAINYSSARQVIGEMDALLKEKGMETVSGILYPPHTFNENEKKHQEENLVKTEYAQPAVGAISAGLFKLMKHGGFKPDYIAGHSFGELTALWAAGAISDRDFYNLTIARGSAMAAPQDPSIDTGAMLAVNQGENNIAEMIKEYKHVRIVNYNSPIQKVLAGPTTEIKRAHEHFTRKGYKSLLLNVSAAFHTDFMAHAEKSFAAEVGKVSFKSPLIPVYSNTTGKVYPDTPESIKKTLVGQMLNPVLFKQEIENIYADGGYLFVEFGPKNILTNLVKNILGDKPHLAVALNPSAGGKDEEVCLRQTVVRLKVSGLPLKSIDPHRYLPEPDTTEKSEVAIKIDGNSYVTNKTKEKFLKALEPEIIVNEMKNYSDQENLLMQPNIKNQNNSSLLENQNLASQVHNQFLNTQSHHLNIIDKITEQQRALIKENGSNPQSKTVLDSLQKTLVQLQKNHEMSLKIHESYLNNQMGFLDNTSPVNQQRHDFSIKDSSQVAENQDLLLSGDFIDRDSSTLGYDDFRHTEKPVVETEQLNEEPVQVPDSNERGLVEPAIQQPDSKTETGETGKVGLKERIISVVSEATGYPEDMLDLDMDLEADMGVDSIKFVEIFAVLQEDYPEITNLNPEDFAELRTLREIVDCLEKTQSASDEPASDKTEEMQPQEIEVIQETHPSEDFTGGNGKISTKILSIISEKTGHPEDSLELDMDLETDMGVDMIKLIDISKALQEEYPEITNLNPEDLTELRTLKQIINYVNKNALAENKTLQKEDVDEKAKTQTSEATQTSDAIIKRFTVVPKYLPKPDYLKDQWVKNAVFLITDDGSGLSLKLAHELRQRGQKPLLLSFPESIIKKQTPIDHEIDSVNLERTDYNKIEKVINGILEKHESIAGFIHVSPVYPKIKSIKESFNAKEQSILRSVFFIGKLLKTSLNKAGLERRSFFITVSRLDGECGIGGKRPFVSLSGGLAGMTKSLNWEWKNVFCRSIDIGPDYDQNKAANVILSEMEDSNPYILETGYSPEKGRMTLNLEDGECLSNIQDDKIKLDHKSNIIVTGGGRGITADCVVALASTYKCKFILLGRTSIDGPMPEWFKDDAGKAEQKKMIIDELLDKGEKTTPVTVEIIYQGIKAKSDIGKTLALIREKGGEAVYLSVDITNKKDLKNQLASVIAESGPIKGIIHGAGNLADKRIERKTEKDFKNVFTPKVIGLKNLLDIISPDQLESLVLFSSVSSFYGNAGQTDYAMANEVLNKLAHCYQTLYPKCNVTVFNWGPWDKGMVSPELKKLYKERQIDIIPVEKGAQILVDDFKYHQNGQTQILVQGQMGIPLMPLITNDGPLRIYRKLTSSDNPFLNDHVINGSPVLPLTCALSWIIRSCEELCPGYTFFNSLDYKVLKGIVFDSTSPEEYMLELKTDIVESSNPLETIEIEARILSAKKNNRPLYHYSARIQLRKTLPPSPVYDNFRQEQDSVITEPGDYFYTNQILFHGKSFQGIKEVINIDERHITLRCTLPEISLEQQGQFPVRTFNPYTTDVQLHGALIWSQHCHQKDCLPMAFKKVEQYAKIPYGKDEEFFVSIEIKEDQQNVSLIDIITHDSKGRVYMYITEGKAVVLKGMKEKLQEVAVA